LAQDLVGDMTSVEERIVAHFNELSQTFRERVQAVIRDDEYASQRAQALQSEIEDARTEVRDMLRLMGVVSPADSSSLPEILKIVHMHVAHMIQQASQQQEAGSVPVVDSSNSAATPCESIGTQAEFDEDEVSTFAQLRRSDELVSDLRGRLTLLEQASLEAQHQRDELKSKVAASEMHVKCKGDKVVELLRTVESQSQQLAKLSAENAAVRLECGNTDATYCRITIPESDPLSSWSAGEELQQELEVEEHRFIDDLKMVSLRCAADNSSSWRAWSDMELERRRLWYRSMLHVFQRRQSANSFKTAQSMEFQIEGERHDAQCAQQEAALRDADERFQEQQTELTRDFLQRKAKLIQERDSKMTALLEQAERSQTDNEKQMLIQQARLFGQRMDQRCCH